MAPGARIARLASALALVLCAACGRPEAPSAPGPAADDGQWHARPREHWPSWGLSQKEYVRIDLPEAENASEDRSTPVPRLVLNLLPRGDLTFKGCVWPLETGVPEERTAALAALQQDIGRLLADPALQDEDGWSLVPVMLHADRECSWATVRALLPVLLDPRLRIRHLQIAVHAPARTFERARQRLDHRLDAQLLRDEEAGERSEPLRVHLDAAPGGTGTETRLAIGDRVWTFGSQDRGFEDPAFLAQANAVWPEVEAYLATAVEGVKAASVEIPERGAGPWWGYVVKTIDLLLGAGIRKVTFPEADLCLRLDEPVAVPPQAFEDDPVVTPGLLAACALAVLLAFALVFLPLRRGRGQRAFQR